MLGLHVSRDIWEKWCITALQKALQFLVYWKVNTAYWLKIFSTTKLIHGKWGWINCQGINVELLVQSSSYDMYKKQAFIVAERQQTSPLYNSSSKLIFVISTSTTPELRLENSFLCATVNSQNHNYFQVMGYLQSWWSGTGAYVDFISNDSRVHAMRWRKKIDLLQFLL